MSIEAKDDRSQPFVWVNLEFCSLDIDPASKAVYLEIARRSRQEDEQGKCWESVEHIAHWANVGVATAKRSLARLIEWGMITRESREGYTSLYRLTRQSKWTAPTLKKPESKRRGRPKTTQDNNDPAQIKPSSEMTQANSDLGKAKPSSEMTQGGGSNLDRGGGSNLTHKLDLYELDPEQLDPVNELDPITPLPPRLTNQEDAKTSILQGELIQFPLPGTENSSGDDKSSGNSPQKEKIQRRSRGTRRKGGELIEFNDQEFVDFYNSVIPDSFSELDFMTPSRRQVVSDLIVLTGSFEGAKKIIENAASWVKSEHWYRGKILSFENFSSNGKFVELSGKWKKRQAQVDSGQAFLPTGNEANDRVMSQLQHRMEYLKRTGQI